MTRYVGIDPGLDGAIVALDAYDLELRVAGVWDMPTFTQTKAGGSGERRMFNVPQLALALLNAGGVTAIGAKADAFTLRDVVYVLENPRPMPAMGLNRSTGQEEKRQMGATSAHAMGMALALPWGVAGTLVTLYGGRMILVAPQTWKAKLGLKGKDKGGDSIAYASALYPAFAGEYLTRKMDHNRADALLIAEWARREGIGR